MRHGASMIALLLLAGQALAAPAAKVPSLYPILDTDKKLRATITLESKPETVGALLAAVSKKAGIQLCCQGDYLGRKVVQRVVDQEVREVLTQIAFQAHGFWLRRKGVYWLLDEQHKQLLPFFQEGASMGRATDLIRSFIGSLSAAQWAQLRAGGGLTAAELTGQQRTWFVSAWNQEYGLHPNRYHEEQWFSKKGGLITYAAEDDSLVLWMPRVNESGALDPEPLPWLRVAVHPGG